MFGIWVLLIVLVAIIFFIILFSFSKMNPRSIYFALASLGSLLWMIISYWTSLSNLITWSFFPIESYINCENVPQYDIGKPYNKDECYANQKQDIERQKIENSKSVLQWLVWWFIFALVFQFHYPILRKCD